jgi:guanylate kinase
VTVPGLTVLAGPAAVGKGTVVSALRRRYPEIVVSVSVTTRPPRPREREGREYHFVSDAEFDRLIATDALLEWARVHQVARYGTPRLPVEQAVAEGRAVLLEIDLQGARQVRTSAPEARFVFLAPPDFQTLVDRLQHRGTETAQDRERRLETAREELAAQSWFDHVIVNDEVGRAAAELASLMGLEATAT